MTGSRSEAMIVMRAEPFPASRVRLLEGPFLTAQKLNGEYLLWLDPDRLLHNFRGNTGLTPKAPRYGCWESQEIAGHTLGHYLSACSHMYASTGDAAAVLGGCSLRGGEGSIISILIGTALLQVLQNLVNLLNIPSSLNFAVVGTVILLGVTTDELIKRHAAAKIR